MLNIHLEKYSCSDKNVSEISFFNQKTIEKTTNSTIDNNFSQCPFSPQMESATEDIHSSLNDVIDSQTHFKLREATGRIFAEDLHARVNYWSIGETLIILMIGLGQVFILRSFFTDKKTSGMPIHS